mgnify:CR=1 FL=1
MNFEMKKTKEVKHVADIIGEWGNWRRHFFIYLFIQDIIGSFNNMGYSFNAFETDFWCEDVPKDYKVLIYSIQTTLQTIPSSDYMRLNLRCIPLEKMKRRKQHN